MFMRKLLAITVLALFALPVLAQPLQVGGEYGLNWLTNFGSKNVVRDVGGGLWSWGTVPKGQYLFNNTLHPIGTSTWIFPAFMDNATPLLINDTTPTASANLFPPDFGSPAFMDDPWFVAQITGQPVVYRSLPF
jgi:hypothetical protein